jgi:uncharacterized phage protein gp47/JayE
MPLLGIPSSIQVLSDRTRSDIQQTLPESNPFLKNEYLDAIITANDGRIYEFYKTLQVATSQLFANTSTGQWLEGWGAFKDVHRNPATEARGRVVVTGTSGTVIPFNTVLNANGIDYIVQSTANITTQNISVTSLTRSGTTVTATAASEHGLASGVTVTMSGAVETDYNGAFVITVISATEFTYQIETTPTTPATGTILATLSFAGLEIASDSLGQNTNLASGAQLTFATPIAGADSTAYVDFDAIAGGADEETDAELLVRVKEAFAFPEAYWNKNFIIAAVKEVSGNTRAFVFTPGTLTTTISITSMSSDANGVVTAVPATVPTDYFGSTAITISGANEAEFNVEGRRAIQRPDGAFVFSLDTAGSPTTATGTIELSYSVIEPGTVVIYFLRDNDINPIPDGAEVTQTKDYLLSVKPADRYEEDIIVRAPTAVSTNFTFTALSPNTATMQTAISANLRQLFDEQTAVGQTLVEDAYRSAIYNTIDTATGDRVTSFTLSTPTTDIVANFGEIPTLGTITYP